ncbi:AAA family ATPase [Rubellimicrobium arenae]|uniref:AAA family ATPase n=1 Tax=Rubellimicrobium arenae TaxID=2817372 RepID=UPI001B301434|nr:AAA family ATPase [Rubellimicrobium arenae]
MRSLPAPGLITARPKPRAPGELARAYLQRLEAAEREARRRDTEVDRWRAQTRRNARLDKGRGAALIAQSLAGDGSRDDPRWLPPQAAYALPESDRARIKRAAATIEARRLPPTPLPTRIAREERDELFAATHAMRLSGVATEAEVDEAFAAIHAEFPWLARATEILWHQARLRARDGLPFRVGPVVLLGPPGCGKSSFARALGAPFSVPTVTVDVGQAGGVWDLQGSDSKWGGSSPGRITRSLLATRIGNPVVAVDEIDAGRAMGVHGGGRSPSIHRVMMGMIEPSTGAAWVCPYYEVAIDLRHHSWVMTTNSVMHIEQALLDRVRVIELDAVGQRDLVTTARRMAAVKLDEEGAELVAGEVERALKRGANLGLRQVARLVEAAEAAANRPVLH